MGEKVRDFIAELVVFVAGWAFCMLMLALAFGVGHRFAPQFGGEDYAQSFGILSAIVFIWLYEHRRADERWTRFFQQQGG